MFKFPWGDFHSLNLGWFLQKFNELREDWATAEAGIDGALDAEIQKAEDALTDVFAARDAAAASASAANSSALNASQSSLASMDARDQSRAARDAAQQAATNAAGSASAAADSATAAAGSATAAAGSATQAGQSAGNAANSAAAAAASAESIEGDVDAAAASATAAAASETAAGNSAIAAEQSARDAEDAATTVGDSVQQIATNTIDIADLKSTVDELIIHNAIESRYPQFSAIENSETKIVLNTGYIAAGITRLKLNWFYENLFNFDTVQFNKTLNDAGEVENESSTKYVTDFIDVSNYNSVTLRLLYGWSSSHRNRLCGYNENKEFVRLLWSNATTNRDQTQTFDVTNIAYIRFAGTGWDTWSSKTKDVIVAITPEFNSATISLENFYGGKIDFTNGVAINKFTESGETTEVQSEFTPIEFLTKNKNYVFANRNNFYYTVDSLTIDFNQTPKTYIDEKINRTQNIIAGIETSMKATKSYSVGDILIAEDTLYKVIAPISNGADFTVNTNVVETTVAEQLIALANA